MPQYDLPLQELRAYRSAVSRPADFDDFWQGTLASARARYRPPRVEPVESPLSVVDVFDVTFSGFDGQPIKAWLHRAPGGGVLPGVVRYAGYNCGRGLPHVVPPLALAGYAVLSMDNRGQGAVAAYVGDTPDGDVFRELALVIRGVQSRDTYLYRRLYTDAALAVDAIRDIPGIDPGRIGVAGVSQGGGLALAVTGLVEDLGGALIDVPFMSDIPRGIALTAAIPYAEFAAYLATYPAEVDAVLRNLAYFDGTVFAARATAPSLFSVGLTDTVCPPSTVFAAYNAYRGPKEIREYPYSGHEGGSFNHEAVQLGWLPQHLPL